MQRKKKKSRDDMSISEKKEEVKHRLRNSKRITTDMSVLRRRDAIFKEIIDEMPDLIIKD